MIRMCVLFAPALFLLFSTPSRLNAQITPPSAVEAAARRNEVRVFWNSVPGATGYQIRRDGVEIGTAGADAKEFSDTTAEPGRNYSYNVAAVGTDGSIRPGRPYLERTYPTLPDETRCDVLVVGATTGGVASAVTAARYGLNVVLIEETRRLGGMSVNGLGASDLRRVEHASGFFEEFRRGVQQHYGTGNGLKYEPRTAHQVMKSLLWAEPTLTVHREVRPVRVRTQDGKITEVTAEVVGTGRQVTFRPQVVIDATECGDVAAWAGAPYRVGREPRSAREPHAGQIYYARRTDTIMPGSTGEGDKRVQAYAYLMTVKDFGPGADKTIPQPPGYDPAKYRGAPKWKDSWAVSSGKLPNDKYEINQHPHGSDLQGVNYGYPNASYAERRRIEQLYKDHALGYLYYLQTVEGVKNIGLSEDDYRDTDGWQTLLYIREARRFEGDYRMDETDIREARQLVRPYAIGIGDYALDSHATQPYPEFDHYSTEEKHMGEGEYYLPQYTPWHQIPLAIMIPKRVENLYVPTAVSATHVAYGTYRMEPVRMNFGTAAGVGAYFCVRYGLTPRQVPARQVQTELIKRRVPEPGKFALDGTGAPGPNANPALVYTFPDVMPGTRKYRHIQWLGARGFYPCPPPAQRTPSSGLSGAAFGPDESLTEGEALRLLAWLANRAGGEAKKPSGDPARTGAILTRARACALFATFMDWRAPAGANHYADLTPGNPDYTAAESLYAHYLDSRLWDEKIEFAPDGRLYFRPEQPITRAQFAELLYNAAIHFGPLWEDHPLDRDIIPVKP